MLMRRGALTAIDTPAFAERDSYRLAAEDALRTPWAYDARVHRTATRELATWIGEILDDSDQRV